MRRALVGLAMCGALLSGSVLPAQGGEHEQEEPRLFAYGRHARQTLTVYGEGGPALVILHGGHWASDGDWSGWARRFAAHGYTVFDVDYRLNHEAHWPAQRTDVLSALRWIRHHRARFGITGELPLVFGSSAGGHLAVSAGTYGDGARRIAGVVALSPVASPYRAWVDGGRRKATSGQRRLRAEAERLAGCRPERTRPACWAVWRDLTAKNHAGDGSQDADLLLFHSTGDFVPPSHSWELAARVPGATVSVLPGSGHASALLREPVVVARILSWLAQRRT
ncbi:alpha/beta hydrolase [Streptomyces sp. GC420]|uniref:alpha/beta hydrolase n=1 Tax=Streptomyces sp. GC420 TaxID=2697568 RepID=UPI001414EC90|nr:alpha/beta hydrolase [Streptomyces sp. GC420]NBM19063.1 alpha/beta hydrolase fold domain-containing protein [Streptomyces sp. GC420]